MRERKAKQRLLNALWKQFRRFRLLRGRNHHPGQARRQNFEKRPIEQTINSVTKMNLQR
jgi:hypothetical protein